MSKSLLILESRIKGYTSILANLAAETEYLVLDSTHDGLLQIAEALAGKSGYDSIQFFSHGSPGSLMLGSVALSLANMNDYAVPLSQIGSALTSSGDIMLYCCNVGAGDEGRAFLDALAALTGADVAASDDLTGAEALGGDWMLEVQSGVVESVVVSADAYEGVLTEDTAPMFGLSGDGKIITDFRGQNDFFRGDIVVQSDEKILVVGSSSNGNALDIALVRYNSDGSLDTSFDSDGKVTTDFNNNYDDAYDVVVQNNGKILVVGSSRSTDPYNNISDVRCRSAVQEMRVGPSHSACRSRVQTTVSGVCQKLSS